MHSNVLTSLGAALVFALGACADDDTESAAGTTPATSESTTDSSAAAGDDLSALATELFEQEDFPSVEQLQLYQQLAPAAIADAVQQVAEPLIATSGDLVASFKILADDDSEAAVHEIDAFEEETCGIPHSEVSALAEGATREIEPDAVRVDVHATDYAFDIGEVASGRTSFVLTNDGSETHEMLVVKLADGVTLDDALQADGEQGTVDESWQTNLAAPGKDEEPVTFERRARQLRLGVLHPQRRRRSTRVPRDATRVHRPLTASRRDTALAVAVSRGVYVAACPTTPGSSGWSFGPLGVT